MPTFMDILKITYLTSVNPGSIYECRIESVIDALAHSATKAGWPPFCKWTIQNRNVNVWMVAGNMSHSISKEFLTIQNPNIFGI